LIVLAVAGLDKLVVGLSSLFTFGFAENTDKCLLNACLSEVEILAYNVPPWLQLGFPQMISAV
jgi:hypothetical protein